MKKKLIAKYDLIDCKDDHDCDVHLENFKGNLDYYFNKYLGHKVIVKGKNMTWKKLSGLKNFDLDNVMDIFEKVIPNTSQLNFIYGKQVLIVFKQNVDTMMEQKNIIIKLVLNFLRCHIRC